MKVGILKILIKKVEFPLFLGINIEGENKKAFIQIIANDESYYIEYDINEFKYSDKLFCIKIGKNLFSKINLHIDIDDKKQNLKINGDIKYSKNENIKTNILNPNIMGPFSYIPFMECNHAILSMKNQANGIINLNNKKIEFLNGIGYIEKDWGTSFPKNYIWCQGNNFKNPNVSFMLSIADIPFKVFNFRGLICDIIINGQEYKFATYNSSKILEYKIDEKFLNIILKKEEYKIKIFAEFEKGKKLIAPVDGKMSKEIYENINSKINITLEKDNKIIFQDTSYNCGLEIVN